MCKQNFVHLHNHSCYSVQDALGQPNKLAKKAREMGFPAIALTDHGHMGGCIDLYEGCVSKSEHDIIKPIFGIEAYYCKDINVKEQIKRPDGKPGKPKHPHITLLAQNQTGYRNLMKASTIASTEGKYYEPRMDWNVMSNHAEGVIALSGCFGSEMSVHLRNDDYDSAKAVAERYKDLYGDNYRIELHYHNAEESKNLLKYQVKIAKELEIPLVISNDVHYINKEDADPHELLIRMRDLKADKLDAVGKRDAYKSKQFWLKSEEEIFRTFKPVMPEEYIRTAMTNTVILAETVDNFMKLNQYNLLPQSKIPNDNAEFDSFWTKHCKYYTASQAFLYYLAAKGLNRLGLAKDPIYRSRLMEEIKTINNMGVEDYIIMQYKTVAFMRSKNISSLARGSASGSLVLYCLGVTNVDPIEHGLLFPRFLNPGRGKQYGVNFTEYPVSKWLEQYDQTQEEKANIYLHDILDKTSKDPALEDILHKVDQEVWVIENQDLAGYFYDMKQQGVKLENNDSQSWTAYLMGLTDKKPVGDLEVVQAASLPDIDTDIEDVRRIEVFQYLKDENGEDKVANIGTYNTYQAKGAIQNAIKANEGLVAKYGDQISAYAIEVSKTIPFRANPPMTIDDAIELSPPFKAFAVKYPDIIRQARGVVGAINSMGVHAAGILVSSEPLTDHTPLEVSKDVVCSAYDMAYVEKIGLVKYDLLGSATLSTVKRALDFIEARHGRRPDLSKLKFDDQNVFNIFKRGKLSSIFQFSSFGMKSTIQSISPDGIEDLIAINALYRPGPMDYIPDYAKGKKNPSAIKYSDPILEKHLGPTFGIMIYQEQAMFLARELGKLTWTEVDKLRKGIAKKDSKEFEKIRALFRKKAINNGCKEELVDEVLHLMEKFGGYAFNKAHSAAYSVLAYQTAYLRHYYPAEWLAASIEMDRDNKAKLSEYFEECRQDGIKIVQPNVNTSGMVTGVNAQGHILLPLTILNGVGSSATSIVDMQPYESFRDFVIKAGPDKGMVETFAENLALNCFEDCCKKHPAEIMAMFEAHNKDKKILDKINKEKEKQKYTSLAEDIFQDKPVKAKPTVAKPKDKFLKGVGGKNSWFDGDDDDE